MRVMLGIAIALPIAAVFCLAYLTMLALETRRDAALSPRSARNVRPRKATWIGQARIAA